MSKKVLILAYDFPPYVSVGGLRPYNWYRYLNQFDVYPVVITRQWENKYGNFLDYVSASESKTLVEENTENGTIIRTPYKPNLSNRLLLKHGEGKYNFLRKAITTYYEFAQFFFKTGTKVELLHAAREFLKENKVDAIIATGDPFVLFRYAALLSKEFDIPWIADYRDPWTQNKSNKMNQKFGFVNRYFEKSALKTVSKITTVDNFFKAVISSGLPEKEFFILPNGYDPDRMKAIADIKQESDFLQIAFVGTIYEWHPIRSFLLVLNQFVVNHPEAKIKFNLFGINIASEVIQMIEKDFPILENIVKVTPRLQNDILLKELAKHNAMLLFNYYAYTGTKIYDYLGVKRKILLCYTNDSEAKLLKAKHYNIDLNLSVNENIQEEIILKTNSGVVVENAEMLLKELGNLYDEFLQTGQVACNSVNTEQYSRKIQVEKLAKLIQTL
jgi:hypothetical protein